MDLPKRKSLRLQGYDYSQNGAYFVTICTQDKAHTLSRIVVGRDDPGAPLSQSDPGAPRVELSNAGMITEKYINSIPDAYTNVSVDKYVVMPNHVHMIIMVTRPDGGAPGSSRPTELLPRIIAALKRFSNRETGTKLWQTSYHDHIIRNYKEYQNIWLYIDTNPITWTKDEYYL